MAIKATSTITIADISDGINGTGIESAIVEYQAGSSGTEKPTGEWSKTIPETTAALPYLWTRVTYTYTDGRTPLEVYGVGSTPEGIEIGGRNLIRNSNTMNFEDYYFQTEPLTVENDDEGNVSVHYSLLRAKNNDFGGAELENLNVSNNSFGEVSLYALDAEGATESSETIEMKYLTIKDKTFEIVDAKARAQATTNAAGLKVIQTRLAQFESLKEGSTTGDAELMDIRVGYDGVEHGTAGDAVRAVGEDLVTLQTEYNEYITTKAVDGLLYENNMLYLTCRGEIISDGVEIKQGSGTGGGGGTSVLRLTNQNGTTVLSAAAGKTLELKFNFISLEDDMPTGDGTCQITVNGATKATFSIPQGLTTVDIKDYLSVGANNVKVTCTDVYGNYRTITYSVSVIELLIESSFDDTVTYSGDITFKYTPYGLIEKTVHFYMDGNEVDTTVVKSSSKQYTKIFDAMPHGVHRFEVIMTAIMDGNDIESNRLVYDIMCTESGISTILIASPFMTTNVMQGEQISIPFSVYNPASLTTDITLTVYSMSSGSRVDYSVSEMTVDRTRQTWNTRRYPIGTAYFEIKVVDHDVSKTHQVEVAEPQIDVQPETNDLEMVLSSAGRSNNENNPAVWTYGNIRTKFDHVNWDSTGWVEDENGDTALHLNGDATATISFKPFSKDLRLQGKTIELEFVIRDINNRNAVVIDCMSGNIGIKATADRAVLQSELASIDCRYKEDVKIRVAFVIESRNENRMMSVYLNGVRSGTKQYTANDNFQQTTPVEIKIGSPYCAIDLYTIRSYDTALSPISIRNNYIADIQDITKKVDTYENNDIYDEYNNLSYDKLKTKLPTITIVGTLPASKGNKQNVKIIFEDPKYPNLNFTANCVIDVQGTSSQYYVRKNWKLKFSEQHQHAPNMIPTKVFCLKVDYAEATGTHNTQIANYVHTLYDELLPPQAANPAIRSTIYGFPSVIFHQSNDLAKPTFYGKSNFNYDKGSENVFGFTDEYDVECWEFCNNTSDVCNFKAPLPANWGDDFEARYPEESTDTTRLAAMLQWVYDTRNDLTKFKNEFEDHFDKHYTLMYYVFTHFMLMVDQRAKNMMFTYWAVTGKWYPYFYDNDTCLGINNEGQLVFDYYHEDTDQLNGANVYNGQGSVLWNNVRIAFADDIAAMYRNLRSSGKLTYDKLIECFITNGSDMWSESVYNEDSEFKYIDPLEESGDASNLYQVRGDGEMHLMYFLKNRFNYFDSKYYAQDYADDYVYLRVYTPVDSSGVPRTDLVVPACADVTLTAYSDMYAGIRYKANGTLQQQRISADETITFTAPDETFNDTETSVYGASNLSSLGDLSPLYAGSINVAKATHLVELIVGSPKAGYDNPNLNHIAVGNNKLLKKIDIRNCSGLTESLDLSGCPNIEEIYAEGSAITGVDLTRGGHVRVIHLPTTIRSLTLLNQVYIEDFKMDGYSALKTLRIENCHGVDEVTILENATNLERVRLVGVDWHLEDVSFLKWLYNSGIAGIDETGANVDEIQVSGKCYIESLTGSDFAEIVSKWPYLKITYGTLISYLYFMSDDGETTLYTQTIANGGNGSDPVTAGSITTPTKESTAQYHFAFAGWSKTIGGDVDKDALLKVEADRYVYAAYSKTIRSYTVRFLNYDGTVLQTSTADYGTDVKYTGKTPTNNSTGNPSDFSFVGWNPSPTNIKGDTDCYAQYYDTREITDDWETIQKNCYSGNSSKYAIGSYKNAFVNGKELPKGSFAYYNWVDYCVYNGEVHVFHDDTDDGFKQKHYKFDGSDWVEVSTIPYDYTIYYPSNVIVWNNEIHMLGNNTYRSTSTNHYKWDGAEWSSVSTLPYDFYGGSIIIYNNEMHILGSNETSTNRLHYKWDGVEWSNVSTLPCAFTRGIAVVYNDKIHILSGGNTYNHYEWDGNNWTQLTTLPASMDDVSGGVYNGKIYFKRDKSHSRMYSWDGTKYTIEQESVDGFVEVVDDIFYALNNYGILYQYSEADNLWIPLGTTDVVSMEVIDHDHDEIPDDEFLFVESDIPKLPDSGRAVVHEGELYCICANEYSEDASYKYNASTNTWDVLCENTPIMATRPNLLSYNGEIHAIGGYSVNSYIHTKMEYQHLKWDGTSWTVLDPLPFSCDNVTCIAVYQGKMHMVFRVGYHYAYDGTSWSKLESGEGGNSILFVFVWNDTLYAVGQYAFWTYAGDQWSEGTQMDADKTPATLNISNGVQVMIHNNEVYLVNTASGYTKDAVYKFDETGFTKVYERESDTSLKRERCSSVVNYNYRWYAISYYAERHRKISWGEFEVDPREWIGYSHQNSIQTYGKYCEVQIGAYERRLLYFATNKIRILKDLTWSEYMSIDEETHDGSGYGRRWACDGIQYAYGYINGKLYKVDLRNKTYEMVYDGFPPGGSDLSLDIFDGKLHATHGNYCNKTNCHSFFNETTNEWETGYGNTLTNFTAHGVNRSFVYRDALWYSYNNQGFAKLAKGATEFEWVPCEGLNKYVWANMHNSMCQPVVWNDKVYMLVVESSGVNRGVVSFDCTKVIDEWLPVSSRGNLATYQGKLYMSTGMSASTPLLVFNKPRAPLTWAAKHGVLAPSYSDEMSWYTPWSNPRRRKYVTEPIKELLPSSLQNSIAPVTKYTLRYDIIERTTDYVWTLSLGELGFDDYCDGPAYPVFTDDNSRKITIKNISKTSYYYARTSVNEKYDYSYLHRTGNLYPYSSAYAAFRICFCI